MTESGRAKGRAPLIRRLARWGCLGLVLGSVGLGGLVGGGFAWLNTASGQDAVRGQITSLVTSYLTEGTLEVGTLDTNFFDRAELTGLVLRDGSGRAVLSVDRVTVGFDLTALFDWSLKLDSLEIADLELESEMRDSGYPDLAEMLGLHEGGGGESLSEMPVGLHLGRIAITGESSARLHRDDVVIGLLGLGVDASVDAPVGSDRVHVPRLLVTGQTEGALELPLTLGADFDVLLDVGVSMKAASVALGDASVEVEGYATDLVGAGNIAVRADIDSLPLDTVEAFLGVDELIQGTFTGPVQLSGSLHALRLDAMLSGADSALGVVGCYGLIDVWEQDWEVKVLAENLHLHEAVSVLPGPVVAQGLLEIDGQGLMFPDELSAEGRFTGTGFRLLDLEVDRIELGIEVAAGKLSVSGLEVESAVGMLDGGASLDLVKGDLIFTLDGAFDARRLADLGVPGLAGRGVLHLELEGDVLSDTPSISVMNGSTVKLSGITHELGPRIGWTDVRVAGDITPAAAELDARIVVGDVSMRGVPVLERLTLPSVAVRLDPVGELSVGGSVRSSSVGVPERAALDGVQGRFSFRGNTDLEVSASARLDLLPFAIDDLDLFGDGGSVAVQLAGGKLQMGGELLERGTRRTMAEFDGWLDLNRRELALRDFLLSPTRRQAWTDTGNNRLRLTPGNALEIRLGLADRTLGSVSMEGLLELNGALDASVVASDLQLDVLSELAPRYIPAMAGRVGGNLQIGGEAKSPFVSGEASATHVYVEGLITDADLSAMLSATRDEVAVNARAGLDGAEVAVLRGALPVRLNLRDPWVDPSAPVNLDLTLISGPQSRFSRIFVPPEWQQLLPDGSIAGEIRLRGPLRDPEVDIEALADVEVDGVAVPFSLELQGARRGEVLTWEASILEGQIHRADLVGGARTRVGQFSEFLFDGAELPDFTDLDLYLDRVDTQLTLDHFPIGRVTKLARLPVDIDGELTARVDVDGSLARPRVAAEAKIDAGALGKAALDVATARITPTSDGYDVEARAVFAERILESRRGQDVRRERGSVEVEGLIPLQVDLERDVKDWAAGDVQLEVGGEGIPLAVVTAGEGLVGGFSTVEGLIVLGGGVTGPLYAPDLKLRADLEDGVLASRYLGARFEDIDLAVQTRGLEIALDHFSANSRPVRGTLRGGIRLPRSSSSAKPINARGVASLAQGMPTGVQIEATLDRAVLAAHPNRFAMLTTTPKLSVEGDWPALHTSGGVRVDHASLFQDAAALLEAAPLELDSAITMHREKGAIRSEEPSPPFWSEFTSDIRVDLGSDTRGRVLLAFLDDFGGIGATLTTADVSGVVAGTLRVGLKAGLPVLNGKVDVLSGTARVAQAKFQLKDTSQVQFQSDDFLAPDLDIAATMPVSEGAIDMRITGIPFAPKIDFSSERYPDQTTIFMILITGKPPDELNAEQGLSALGALLLNTALTGINLGQLSIDAQGSARVLVPITRTLRLETKFVVRPQLLENVVALGAEWRIVPNLVLKGEFGDKQRGFLDLLWERRW